MEIGEDGVRVLFVDDEQAVLDGLTRALFHRADLWDVETANSGAAALEIMEAEAFDVIVVDVRMPSMDGAELLSIVRDRYPDTVRIVLSGQTAPETALRLATLAHQFLAKPCSPDRLEVVVDRACNLRALLRSDELRAAVGDIKALPPVPRLYGKLEALLKDPKAGVADVSALIESDPAMTAKTLQMVNSSFFTVSRTIHRVHDAVNLLGVRMIRDLALVAELYSGAGVSKVSVERLEKEAEHCLRVAAVAKRFFPHDKQLRDDAFMASVLHDVGKLVLWIREPDWEKTVSDYAATEGIPASQAEQQLFGADHAAIGGYLLGVWGLPNAIVEAAAFHHDPLRLHPDGIDLLSVVNVSNLIVRGAPLDESALALLGDTPESQAAWLAEAQASLGGS